MSKGFSLLIVQKKFGGSNKALSCSPLMLPKVLGRCFEVVLGPLPSSSNWISVSPSHLDFPSSFFRNGQS